MLEVPNSAAVATRIAGLFTEDPPVPVRLWAILERLAEGRIVLDEAEAPTIALVQELAEGTTYVAGRLELAAPEAGIERLRQDREVVVCWWPGDPLEALLPGEQVYQGTAIDFTDRATSVDLSRLAVLPAGYRWKRIDRDVAPLLEGFGYYAAMFGSLEVALRRTLGYCVLAEDGRVACESVAGPMARGIAEVGVGTAEEHRGRGLATIAAARVIRACEARGYRLFWNAAEQNAASIALARRLGFQTQRAFRVVAWPKSE